ncbi:PREDICTED: calcium/calmodulin-dependent 3',5'-cyclic nucleotide phosphodiesterase 1B-like, partial [Fulmarus glacialis]|uniref:calcium/calmodulin-dependent 3',5'-cyclic nucleotide phosphodiesterase 1B-like n=1 Tax=Fulmarus glacialis TaxID=30455 RepID=UPI00051B6588
MHTLVACHTRGSHTQSCKNTHTEDPAPIWPRAARGVALEHPVPVPVPLTPASPQHYLTEIEVLAIIFAAAIHDYEHTGTTNSFHIQTKSDCAILYNDRSVLENHHISAVFRMMQDDEMNIFVNLTKDEFAELRALVIEMVLATDMSCHFQQVKSMKTSLQQLERIDKSKVLSLLLHAADISHPTKQWSVQSRWTKALMEEFFCQGDKEAELGLPFSPLCDRTSTLVAQSQI